MKLKSVKFDSDVLVPGVGLRKSVAISEEEKSHVIITFDSQRSVVVVKSEKSLETTMVPLNNIIYMVSSDYEENSKKR